MKTLTRIQALNIQGRAIDHQLAPMTAVVGRNTGGKTALTKAIIIGLLGYLPTLGKKPSATIQVMTPGAKLLDVQIEFSDGSRLNRRFDVKRSVSQSVVGDDFAELLNPVQIDFGQFTAAKPTERQRILESLLTAVVADDVIGDARTRIAATGVQIPTVLTGDGWLAALEQDARDAGRLVKQDLDTAAKTILQLSAEEAPERADAEAAANTTAKLAQLREEMGACRQKWDTLSERQQNAPECPEGEPPTAAQLEQAEAALNSARQDVISFMEASGQWGQAQNRAAAIMQPFAGIEPLEAVAPMSDVELSEWTDTLSRSQQLARAEDSRTSSELRRAKHDLEAAETKANQLRDSECCPTCGLAGKMLRDQLGKLLDADLAEKRAAVEKAQQASDAAIANLNSATNSAIELEAAQRAARQHKAFLALMEADKIRASVTKPEGDLEGLRGVEQAADRSVRRLRADMESWTAYRAAVIPTDVEVEDARRAFETARVAVESLEQVEAAQKTARAAWDRWQADQERLASMSGENNMRESQIKALDELAKWAKAKSLELTAEAMKPLLAVCNQILDGLTDGTLAIMGTDIGIQIGETFRPLEVLSGSESKAVATAIQVAIAGKSQGPRIVVVDELSAFEEERKARFVANLDAAIEAGMIDQVILIDHDRKLSGMVEASQSKAVAITIAD